MTFSLTAREINGVFRIRYENRVGTAFLYHTSAECVFATAAHNLSGLHVGDNVLIQRDADWIQVTTTDFVADPKGYDVCFFSGANLFIDKLQSPYGKIAMELGAPFRFLGFPHGLKNTYPGNGFPMPLVRTAYFSGIVNLDGHDIMLLDGFNNPGYSGGPVFTVGLDGKPALAGVISGYRFEIESHGAIYQKNPDGQETALPDLYVKPNSGMIYCVGIGRLDELVSSIKKFNPIVGTLRPD